MHIYLSQEEVNDAIQRYIQDKLPVNVTGIDLSGDKVQVSIEALDTGVTRRPLPMVKKPEEPEVQTPAAVVETTDNKDEPPAGFGELKDADTTEVDEEQAKRDKAAARKRELRAKKKAESDALAAEVKAELDAAREEAAPTGSTVGDALNPETAAPEEKVNPFADDKAPPEEAPEVISGAGASLFG